MQTQTIDVRTDKALAACLRVNRPVAVLAYDYGAGDVVPVHEHAKAQLIYAVEGTMTVATSEGRWVLLPTRAVWVPAHTRHSIRMRGPVRMRTVFFGEAVVPPASTCAVVHVSALLRELILAMFDEPKLYALQGRGAQMAELLCSELRQSEELPLHLPWPKDARLRRVCNGLQRRPVVSGDMELWAAREGVSSRTLARLFRAELGMSFQEWRLQLLLLEAQIRLAEGAGIAAIARSLGYASHAAFSAMFRRATGEAPAQQRKRMHGVGEDDFR